MDDYNEVRNQQPENNEENEQFTDQMLLAISKKYEGWNRDEHGQEHDVQGGLLHPAKPRANKCRRRGPRSLGKPVHITTPFPEASMRLIKAVARSCSRS